MKKITAYRQKAGVGFCVSSAATGRLTNLRIHHNIKSEGVHN